MGNKVRIERICEFCGKTFIAKTCKTRFCCKACNDKYYKELIRSDRYNAVTKEVKEEKKKRIRLAVDELEVIQAREFISLKQLAIYLGVSRKSIYTYMRIYEIPFSQIGSRIIVKRKEVETVMMNLKSVKTMQELLFNASEKKRSGLYTSPTLYIPSSDHTTSRNISLPPYN